MSHALLIAALVIFIIDGLMSFGGSVTPGRPWSWRLQSIGLALLTASFLTH
jgi:hypothetical protein